MTVSWLQLERTQGFLDVKHLQSVDFLSAAAHCSCSSDRGPMLVMTKRCLFCCIVLRSMFGEVQDEGWGEDVSVGWDIALGQVFDDSHINMIYMGNELHVLHYINPWSHGKGRDDDALGRPGTQVWTILRDHHIETWHTLPTLSHTCAESCMHSQLGFFSVFFHFQL